TNLKEFLALSEKNLSRPPPGLRTSAARVRRRLFGSVARTTIPLVASPPGRAERSRIRGWMRKSIWHGSGFGRGGAWSDRFGVLPWVGAILGAEARVRQLAKRFVIGFRRSVR